MFFTFVTSVLQSDNDVAAPIGIDGPAASAPGSVANENVIVMPASGLISTLVLQGDTAAATATESYTIEKNGAGTAVVAHTAIGDPTAQDLVHSVAVVKNDLVGIKHNVTGSPNFTTVAGSFVLIPT